MCLFLYILHVNTGTSSAVTIYDGAVKTLGVPVALPLVVPATALAGPVISMAAEVMDFDEVSASPAYTSLDELAEAGRLTQAQVQLFKSKFAKLHEVVLKTYENEKSLLKKAKQLNADLGNERTKLEEATKQAEVDSERVSQLRAEVGIGRMCTQSLARLTQARRPGASGMCRC
eukprot:scaffold3777_cov123-Isochrysis_galbana.AAC.13